MTSEQPTPWFDELSADDKAAYDTRMDRLSADLEAAADFMNHHRLDFPIGQYALPVDILYFVRDEDDHPAETFAMLADNVREQGGNVFDRDENATGNVQHVAELPIGSGRVVYRVTWIERKDSTDE